MYKSDFYQLEADFERGLLKALWLRPVNENELKIGGMKLYEVLRDTKLERVVANAQSMTALTTETKEWMSASFYKLLSQTELKKLARVLPVNLFHQLALESVITRAEALGNIQFQTRNFSDQESALSWLFA